jgi:LuxR family transcriptional regulator, maltose regulon positive regulatory protein
VVTAVQGAVPGVGASALELLASSPVPTELVLTTLLNELAAAPGEVWLVLDDYHLVDNHEVNEGLAFLLEHLPSQVHVVVSTRADPDLPLARWWVRGELVEIRAADLRFTPDETNAYLNVHLGPGGAARDAHQDPRPRRHLDLRGAGRTSHHPRRSPAVNSLEFHRALGGKMRR